MAAVTPERGCMAAKLALRRIVHWPPAAAAAAAAEAVDAASSMAAPALHIREKPRLVLCRRRRY